MASVRGFDHRMDTLCARTIAVPDPLSMPPAAQYTLAQGIGPFVAKKIAKAKNISVIQREIRCFAKFKAIQCKILPAKFKILNDKSVPNEICFANYIRMLWIAVQEGSYTFC